MVSMRSPIESSWRMSVSLSRSMVAVKRDYSRCWRTGLAVRRSLLAVAESKNRFKRQQPAASSQASRQPRGANYKPMQIRTIDAHTAGEPLRLIIDGFPRVEGSTMLERREWVRANCDHLRTALMLEPRGHADMYGALLTEPERPDSDAGVLFMHNEGYSTMCGHGVIAVVTMALERGLIVPRNGDAIVLDAPAGQIRTRARVRRDAGSTRVERVSFVNVPSFTLHAALPIRLGSREVSVDVAFGGAFYAIVDAESAGLPVRAEYLSDLRRAGMAIKHAVEAAVQVAHPEEPGLNGIYGTIFTGPPSSETAAPAQRDDLCRG